MAGAPAKPRGLTAFDATVVEVVVETADTKTLVLDVGPHGGQLGERALAALMLAHAREASGAVDEPRQAGPDTRVVLDEKLTARLAPSHVRCSADPCSTW